MCDVHPISSWHVAILYHPFLASLYPFFKIMMGGENFLQFVFHAFSENKMNQTFSHLKSNTSQGSPNPCLGKDTTAHHSEVNHWNILMHNGSSHKAYTATERIDSCATPESKDSPWFTCSECEFHQLEQKRSGHQCMPWRQKRRPEAGQELQTLPALMCRNSPALRNKQTHCITSNTNTVSNRSPVHRSIKKRKAQNSYQIKWYKWTKTQQKHTLPFC